ncbi:MAG: type III pantothenate kinase [Coprothermobacterota bacterium]|nr:type III pantothenate kinase [Coprothermobacterota bacterium]
MLLAVDVGNTNIVIGLFGGTNLLANYRLHTNWQITADEIALDIQGLLAMRGWSLPSIKGMVLGCVVPPLVYPLTRFADRYLQLAPLVVGPGTKTGIPILLDNPKELAADLIANAVGAQARFGAPVIVVDFGTATTFSAISARGEYTGAVIAPGMKMALDALFLQTARLPRVEIVEPRRVIGKNTVEAMQSGIFFGFVGLATEIIQRMQDDLGHSTPVVATGGLSVSIGPFIPLINTIEPNLTLEGLRLIFERNQPVSAS